MTGIAAALARLPQPDHALRADAGKRQQQLTKPPGSLGRLEELAIFLAGWSRDGTPTVNAAKVIIFAANHGVTAQGVSPYPSSVTAQMVANFQAGGAAINAITGSLALPLDVIPMDLAQPTADITLEPAMSEAEFLSAFNTGAASITTGLDLVILGEMGIGNTTIAAALAASSLGGRGADWAGPGTGSDSNGVSRKAEVVDRALARHAHADTAAERLRCLGGREIAALAGAILAARQARIPVLLDGFVVTAALATLFSASPAITDHCIAGHLSAEPAHRKLLDALGLQPLLDLGMRLGEGSGAALAFAILKAAVSAHTQMATFDSAGVSNKAPAP